MIPYCTNWWQETFVAPWQIILFRHKRFTVARDGPKDYACDGDYYL